MRLRAGAHPHVMVASAGGHAFLPNKLHQISNENLSTQKIYQFTMNAFLPSKLHQIFKENSFSKLHQISNEIFCAK